MPKLTNQSISYRARKSKLEKIAQAIDMAHQMLSMRVPIYMLNASQLGGPYMSLTFAILAKGRCFFGPSAKGLRSRRSLNLLIQNKLIMRGATVGGLPLPKVLKNLTNMFQYNIDCYRRLRLWDEGVCDMKVRSEGRVNEHQSCGWRTFGLVWWRRRKIKPT